MDDAGYVFEHRAVMEHPVFQDDWLYRLFRWCIMKANYLPARFRGVEVPVGSFITGTKRAAEELGVAPSKWFRGVHKLEAAPYEVISLSPNRDWTMITVCNYSTYQPFAGKTETPAKRRSETRVKRGQVKAQQSLASDDGVEPETPAKRQRNANETPANTIEESNNSIRQEGNKETLLWPDGHETDSATATEDSGTAEATTGESPAKATPIYPDLFEAFWSAYPPRGGRRRGKDKCFDIWRREVPVADRQPLVIAAKAYSRTKDVRNGYARDPERFLAKAWWRSFLEPADESPESDPDPRGNMAVVERYLSQGVSDGP